MGGFIVSQSRLRRAGEYQGKSAPSPSSGIFDHWENRLADPYNACKVLCVEMHPRLIKAECLTPIVIPILLRHRDSGSYLGQRLAPLAEKQKSP